MQTKLYAPHRRSADYVTRQRLLARLDAAQSAKVTLIAAPAGFGKTTLVTDWLAHRRRTAAWLSLDEGDSDPVVFWRYLIAALQTQSTELGQEAAQLLQTPQPPALQPLLARLINEIVSHPAPFLLVLDDYHTVDHPEVDDSLLFFIEHMPPSFHLIVTSRVDPNLPLARWRVRRELVEIRTDDLRFTPAEAATFLSLEHGVDVPTSVVNALEARTEGWIAGLQMAALSLQNATDPSSFVDAFSGSHRYVMDYLTDEVLERQPADVHAFLLNTSILDRFCADLCNELLVDQPALAGQSQRLLAYLDRANLFLIALDDEGRWYRYHHLFADLLRRRLYHPPHVDVPDLHRRAARWYAAQGHADEAVHHFLAAEDSASAADLVQDLVETMLFRGETKKLWSWISALPDSSFATRPLLAIGAAWIHYFKNEPQSVPPLLDYVDAYVADPTMPHARRKLLQGQASVLRGWVAYAQGRMDEAIATLRRALDLLAADEKNYRGLASFFLGTLLLSKGDIAAGVAYTESGAQLSRQVGNYTAYVGTQLILSTVENERGRAHAARLRIEETLAWLAHQRLDQLPLAGDLYLVLGDLFYQANLAEDAVRCYTESAAVIESYLTDTPSLLILHLAWAHHYIRQKHFDQAERELAQLEKRSIGRPLSMDIDDVLVEAVDLYLRLGDTARARRWAEEVALEEEKPLGETNMVRLVVLARLWLVEGRAQRRPDRLATAQQLLDNALAANQAQGRARRVAQIAILQTLIAQAQGDDTRARAALAVALDAVPVDDYAGLFLDEGDSLRDLLRQLGADPSGDQTHAAAAALLRLLAPVAAPPPTAEDPVAAAAAALPDPLTERELETLRLLASDLSTEEIANRLVVTVATVRSYTKRIYAKLDVHSRIEALHKARLVGMLTD